MITRFRVQNYKALRDVTLDLTPVHVLIGPNDSGKTSLLEAVAAICKSTEFPAKECFSGKLDGNAACHRSNYAYVTISTEWAEAIPGVGDEFSGYEVCFFIGCDHIQPQPLIAREIFVASKGESLYPSPSSRPASVLASRGAREDSFISNLKMSGYPDHFFESFASQLRGVQMYRFSPDWLKVPVTLSPQREGRMEFNGFGLPQLLDHLRNDRERFGELEAQLAKLFPYIKAIELPVREAFEASAVDYRRVKLAEYTGGKGIEFRLDNGRKLPAENASDGVMFVLAYLALLHLPNPPRFLLIEEPENGIHPARLKEIIRILKQLVSEQSHTQVLMTTHSPYVLSEFQPEEVSLCQREESGEVKVRRLSESRSVHDLKDVFNLGEIWTIDGDEKLMLPVGESTSEALDEKEVANQS